MKVYIITKYSAKCAGLLIATALLFFHASPCVLYAEIPARAFTPEDTVRLFLDIIHYDKRIFTDDQWVTTEKDGMKIIKPRDVNTIERDVTYTFDKKNWYFCEYEQNATSETREAAMYFKKDKTPIVAVCATWDNGYSECGSWLKFYTFACPEGQNNRRCELKDITGEIFPLIDSSLFINNNTPAKKILSELSSDAIKVMYKIPRLGTSITAYPAVTGISLNCRGNDCSEKVGALSKYKSIKIDWHKEKGKFVIGKKEPGYMTLFEN